jgi:hypothetical protein
MTPMDRAICDNCKRLLTHYWLRSTDGRILCQICVQQLDKAQKSAARTYRNVHEVTGYTANGKTWCVECARYLFAPRLVLDLRYKDPEYEEICPIFLGDQWDVYPVCFSCNAEIECNMVEV